MKLKDLISKSGIKLIELSLQSHEDIEIEYIRLGEVTLYYNPVKFNEVKIYDLFNHLGFQVIDDHEDIMVENIRKAAIELVHFSSNINSLIRNSDYISERLGLPYDKLSRIFSKKRGKTLENYLIQLKIEKAKELLNNDMYTLSEISYMLGYSSVQYLSNQFKKIVGVTVSQYKEMPDAPRIPLEDI